MNDLLEFQNKISLYTLEMIKKRGFGHVGGSFSIIELLTVLFSNHMNIDPSNPNKEDRDFFVLSKGHAGPAYYATLAAKGYFEESLIYTLNEEGGNLPSHPDKNLTVGVDATTGSLGQGISIAAGIAYGNRVKGLKNFTFAVLGDGECNEGQVWEALQFISNKKLTNLVTIIDNNKIQIDGFVKDISFEFDFKNLLESMLFNVLEVDGQDLKEIDNALSLAKKEKNFPTVIILDTLKGQGIVEYENTLKAHHLRLDNEDEAIFDKYISKYRGDSNDKN